MKAPTTIGGSELHLDEVYLAGATPRGPAVVGGLALVADDHGLTVIGPQPTSVRKMSWGRTRTVACRQPASLPDGRDAVVLEFGVDGQALRFFVPSTSLAPGGALAVEERIAAISRVPVVEVGAAGAGGGAGPNGAGRVSSAGGAAQGQLSRPLAIGEGTSGPAEPVTGTAGPIPMLQAPGALAGGPAGIPIIPPATGGTISEFQRGPTGHLMHFAKGRRRKKSWIAVVLVLLVAAGGAGFVVHRGLKGGGSNGNSHDAVLADEVNLTPGDLPGWKGVPGTTAGALGAFGFRQLSATKVSPFAACTKSSVGEADAVLSVLGFSEAMSQAPGQTAFSSSPLFEDPADSTEAVESNAIVLGSTKDQLADLSLFARPGFPACMSEYLNTVLPVLVGGATSHVHAASAKLAPVPLRSTSPKVRVQGFSMTFITPGPHHAAGLYGNLVVLGSGRVVATLETVSAHQMPALETARLIAAIEQNLSDESS
jgi:hypothetical protein